ncbi:hypothetical protein HMPREF0298_1226, partial [Corynebacterium lipophiloflavum DSM 44291]
CHGGRPSAPLRVTARWSARATMSAETIPGAETAAPARREFPTVWLRS